MKTPNDILNDISSIVAETNKGYTEKEIFALLSSANIKRNKNFKLLKNQFENKVSYFLKTFNQFEEEDLYYILKEVLTDEKFENNENIKISYQNLIKNNASLYEKNNEIVESYNFTIPFVERFENVLNLYNEAYNKIITGTHDRNALDDLRLALELLLKQILKSERTLENNIPLLNLKLKENGVIGEINSLFNRVMTFYTTYQNQYIKHNDNVDHNSIEFIFDLSSLVMRFIIKTL